MSDIEWTRTVTWQDSAGIGKATLSMAGAAFRRAIAERRLPPAPVANLMGFDIVEVGEGRVVFAVEPQEFHYGVPCAAGAEHRRAQVWYVVESS